MTKTTIDELVGAIQEMGAVHRGERKAARSTQVTRMDVAAIRRGMRLTQAEFASVMGISLGTLRNWEQGRRNPDRTASVLLLIAALYPVVVMHVVSRGLPVDASLLPSTDTKAATITMNRVLDPDDPILSEEAMKARLKNGKRGRPAKRLQV